jgi:mono/diheme cytochrome c family protein
MPTLSRHIAAPVRAHKPTDLSSAVLGATLVAAMLASGCAVEVQNTQPAQALKQQAQPPGSVYAGWRVFQDKCAACHGPAASGTAGAPDLLPRLRDMGPRQFVNLVLKRYDWSAQLGATKPDGAVGDAMVDDLVQRKAYMLSMPAWQSEPRVNAHIVDIYAYLSARAQGTQGPERPAQ